jgi:cytochrome c oxidase assembly protein subunit 15
MEQNKYIYVSYWLLLITFLVFLMIIVGGLTRLTDSGLSITRWDLISGILPPLSLKEWGNSFLLYQQIPEFKLLNSSMTLDEFKKIYWWEYAHRLLGRIIGISYIFPLFYFTYKKFLQRKTFVSLYTILIFILLQGFIGWYMVRSGLTERTDVSHYRLSLHLSLAFIIYMMLLWNYLKYKSQQVLNTKKRLPLYLTLFFMLSLLIQISIGAFVSGLDAGQIYQSWPLMNQSYFPDDSNIRDLFSFEAFNTPSLVQFIHRNVSYFIVLLFIFIFVTVFKNNHFFYLRKNVLYVFLFIFIQIFLGILTVISGAHIVLASMHQIGSIFLITASLILVFKNSKIS